MSFAVVSLNCWGGRIHAPLMKFLVEIDADVYCLQEMYSSPDNTPSTLADGDFSAGSLLARPRLFSEVQALLPDHEGRFFPAAQGYLKDGAPTPYAVRYGIATFIHKKCAVIGESAGFVFGEYRPRAFGSPPLPRNAHVVRLWRSDVQKAFVIAHMHGLWLPNGKADTPEREDQAYALRGMVEDMLERGDQAIVCGDFNVLPTSVTLKVLSGIGGLRELVTGSSHASTRTRYYDKPGLFADYMLVSPGVEVERFEVPAHPEVSDHRPLILVCR